jgi:aspartate-semialdehyde dehydrogenase
MSQQKYNLAILGATGNVGRLLLDLVEQRNFPFAQLKLLASPNSAGKTITSSQGNSYTVELTDENAFAGIDIVFASAGASTTKKYAESIKKAGAVLIDNSSAFRMDADVPLVVPQVNKEDIKNHKGIIANPNCSTAPLVLALKALEKQFKIKRVVVSTYQSVSGAGKEAMEELSISSAKALDNKEHDYKAFVKPIAFNLIPQIDIFLENDYTKEEMKLINETKKMLHRDDLEITCTAVRVPVFISHSESVNIEFEKEADLAVIKEIWSNTDDLILLDKPEESLYPTPLEITGKDPVYVGRVRQDNSNPKAINCWIVSDNLRIGAALNTVRIGEELVKILDSKTCNI